MMRMQQILLVFAVVLLMGCPSNRKPQPETKEVVAENPEPTKSAAEKLITDPIVEKAIRESLKKPTGELTTADLDKVKLLIIEYIKLTEVPKGLEKLKQLTTLYLLENQLTNVKGLEKLTHLKTLELTGNQLSDVKGLEKLTQLKKLWLGNNKLIEVPKGLEKLYQLTELSLNYNKLTDVKGLEKLTKLRRLDLSNNQLTDVKGLEKLTQLKTLLILDNPDLTKAQIEELRKALPQVRFIFHNAKR